MFDLHAVEYNERKKRLKKSVVAIRRIINDKLIDLSRNSVSGRKEGWILILGKKQLGLIYDAADEGFSITGEELPVDLDPSAELKLWGMQVYLANEEDMIMIVEPAIKCYENVLMERARNQKANVA